MNLPNTITILRILLIPVFIFTLYLNVPYKEWIAAGAFVLISITDTLDGYLARKLKKVTLFGKFADPLADKLLVISALIFLIGKGVPAWAAFLIIAREIAVTGLRLLDKKKSIAAASILGKLKTATQMTAIVLIILKFRPWDNYTLIAAVIFSLWSGADYFWRLKHVFKDI